MYSDFDYYWGNYYGPAPGDGLDTNPNGIYNVYDDFWSFTGDETQVDDPSVDFVDDTTDPNVDNFDIPTTDNSDWWNNDGMTQESLDAGHLNDLPLTDNIAYDSANDAWFDRDTGQWYDIDGNSLPGMEGLQPREENLTLGAQSTDQVTPTGVNTGPGVLESIGNFFGKLFTGSGGSSSGGIPSMGGASLGGSQQARSQVQSAQQQLQQAQAAGASSAQLSQLRLQLLQANAALSAAQKSSSTTGLMVIGAVALGAILLLNQGNRRST